MQGIACKLDSPGFIHLNEATAEVIGSSAPYSDCGSLPLVADLQEAGFDVQASECTIDHPKQNIFTAKYNYNIVLHIMCLK